MSRLPHIQTTLNELGTALGLGAIPLSEDAHATLQVGEAALTLAYSAEPADLLWLQIDLGAMPEPGPGPGPKQSSEQKPGQATGAADYLLQAGCLAWMNSAITIALGDDGKSVLAYTALPAATLSTDGLKDTLTRLVEATLPVRKQLAAQDYSIEPQTLSPAPSPTMAPGMAPGMLRP